MDQAVHSCCVCAEATRPEADYLVPKSFLIMQTATAAWAAWYGSEKAVSEVADTLRKLRSPEVATIWSVVVGQLPKGMNMLPAQVVAAYLGVQSNRDAVARAMGDKFVRIDVASRLEHNMAQLIGVEKRGELRLLVQKAAATDLVNSILIHFPIFRNLFSAGAFHRQLALPLLYLGALQHRFSDLAKRPSQAERFRVEMAVAVLMRQLPLSFGGLILTTSDTILRLLPDAEPTNSFYQLTNGVLDPTVPLCEQIVENGIADIVIEVQAFCQTPALRERTKLPQLLDMAESGILAVLPGDNVLAMAYSQFCRNFVEPRWCLLIETLSKYADSMEEKLDPKAFPRNFVGRPLDHNKVKPGQAVQLLRNLMAFNQEALDPYALISRADKQLLKVETLKSQITELGANPTAAGLKKLAALAQEASEEILNNRGWFCEELKAVQNIVRVWESFYADWDRMVADGNSRQARKKTQLVPEQIAVQPSAPPALPPDVEELRTRVLDLETALAQRDEENDELRTQMQGLRVFKDSFEPGVRQASAIADPGLLLRIATRDGMTPTDVLKFVDQVAAGRVVILESAWKSAGQLETFKNSGRMLDILCAMVFSYYESLQAGNPDSIARAILGNDYSANESETTSSNRRLRSQREFDYLGTLHYFQRHLKVGNGAGQEGMRIHFDIIDKKVVIAYAGPHLECSTSN